ncbi:MAG TPA: DUF58 domain-containing protein [Bacteroidales bacterium]|nr:DUF58 domain-containing protein [Bacteroidales bacterium]
MISLFKHIFLTARFFIAGAGIVVLFALSFIVHWLFPVGEIALLLLAIFSVADAILLFTSGNILKAERRVPQIMTLGDEYKIEICIRNTSSLKVQFEVLDELPYQFQIRDLKFASTLSPDKEQVFHYELTPVKRGEYVFGNVNLFIGSIIGLISRKQVAGLTTTVRVYPSIIQMKKFELKVGASYQSSEGIKRRRRIGHSYEFDQIKEYVIGDDSRSINWKASSRRSGMMVNQYEEERSQQVYSIIDKSRSMHMPFNDLTLLDYAINTSLVISNVVLQKHDKAGLITFSDKIGSVIPADKSSIQLRKILEALYNEQEHLLEAEYELLYHLVRNVIKNRSLIFLYTNFESLHAFERVLPILRKISRLHLLTVMFFENEAVLDLSKSSATSLLGIYEQTMARKYLHEKNQIVSELTNHGIHCIKSVPSELSINTINKYLELKSRGLI